MEKGNIRCGRPFNSSPLAQVNPKLPPKQLRSAYVVQLLFLSAAQQSNKVVRGGPIVNFLLAKTKTENHFNSYNE